MRHHLFENWTVVITGAGSGQGRAGSLLFAQAGANLAICDLSEDGLAETVKLVEDQTDVEVLALRCDVAVVSEVEDFILAAIDRFGGIDVVYNNAGMISRTPIEDTTEAEWDKITDVNVKGPFFMVKFALPALSKSEHASVINVSSISGMTTARAGMSAYSASKGALMALTRAQARDLAPLGIRVNCLVPGLIDTPMPNITFDKLPPEQREAAKAATLSRSMIPRFGTAEEVASVALFLASPAASYLTGAMIPVDGGWTAC